MFAQPLGMIKGRIRLAEKPCEGGVVVRGQRDADTGGDRYRVAGWFHT